MVDKTFHLVDALLHCSQTFLTLLFYRALEMIGLIFSSHAGPPYRKFGEVSTVESELYISS